ncbi:MAG: DUF1501 domain-containing protein [Bacteroidota bacterium]
MKNIDKLLIELQHRSLQQVTRRHFLRNCSSGLGTMALGAMMGSCVSNNPKQEKDLVKEVENAMASKASHFVPKAKRVIYLHMAGSPSQLELFDYKPELAKLHGLDCPASLLEGKKFAFIRGIPKMLGPIADFNQHGDSGAWISNRLPHFKSMADKVTFLKAMHTDEFNHAPAQLLMHTGSARLGKPSMGAWVAYGLGTENENLPGFIVLSSGGNTPSAGKSVWGSGFLPTVYQGVQCRSKGDPVLYTGNPTGMGRDLREKTITAINNINQVNYQDVKDPEILSRISQYEMAFKMQLSVPEAMDISKEPEYIHEMYGTEPGKASFANNCLLARRLAEQGVRFIQLFHWGWDSHGSGKGGSLEHGFVDRCNEVDKPMTALLTDLEQRGMLDETLVVWGGEFGRTPMQENREGKKMQFYGRDHHTEAFTVWMAGGGAKGGFSYGETDEIGYYGIKDKVHIHDLQATILHMMGMDHEHLTYHFQGRDFRLTDVHGKVVKDVLA